LWLLAALPLAPVPAEILALGSTFGVAVYWILLGADPLRRRTLFAIGYGLVFLIGCLGFARYQRRIEFDFTGVRVDCRAAGNSVFSASGLLIEPLKGGWRLTEGPESAWIPSEGWYLGPKGITTGKEVVQAIARTTSAHLAEPEIRP
jgi:hypothetical protein